MYWFSHRCTMTKRHSSHRLTAWSLVPDKHEESEPNRAINSAHAPFEHRRKNKSEIPNVTRAVMFTPRTETEKFRNNLLIHSKSSSGRRELHLQLHLNEGTSHALATKVEAKATRGGRKRENAWAPICRLSSHGLVSGVSSWVLRWCPLSQQGTKINEGVV